MANMIGLQIAGRNPGFERWLSIGWSGDDLRDVSEKKLSTGDIYYSVKFDSEYWTYELLVCNFIPGDGRDDAITHIGLRVPARTVPVDGSGREVSPADILAKVKEVLVANNFKRRALSYELDRTKSFDTAVYAPLISGLSLRPFWGPALVMSGGMPAFINAEATQIAAKIERLPLCARLGQASVVNIGQFLPEVPLFTMTDAELSAEPQVRVCVTCRNGEEKISELASRVVLNSTDFGYSPVAYRNVSVELSRHEVLSAFTDGTDIVRRDAAVKLDGQSGEVFVSFAPVLEQKDIIIELEGLAAGDRPETVRGELSLDSITLASGAFPLRGEQIVAFQSALARDPRYLVKHLHIKPTSAYEIKDATLTGDTIKVVLSPHAKASVPAGAKSDAGTAMLTILAAEDARWAAAPGPVEIRQTPMGHNPDCVKTCSDYYPEVSFELKEGRRVAHLGFTPAPSSRIEVLVGMPPRVVAEAMQESPGGGVERYISDLSGNRAENISSISRYCSIFAFRDTDRLPLSWFVGRVLSLLSVIVVIVLGGMFIGWHYSEGIDSLFKVEAGTPPVAGGADSGAPKFMTEPDKATAGETSGSAESESAADPKEGVAGAEDNIKPESGENEGD